MKTAPLYIDQILVGCLAAGVFAPHVPREWLPVSYGGAALVVAALVAVAVAYVLGITSDRIADSILSCTERYQRLHFALDRHPHPLLDPAHLFQEDRATVLAVTGGMGEWLDFLRTRIRLSRSLAVYLPGVVASLSVLVVPAAAFAYEQLYIVLIGVPAGWMAALVLSWFPYFSTPRTDANLDDVLDASSTGARRWLRYNAPTLVALSLTTVAGALPLIMDGRPLEAAAVAAAVVGVALLCGWTWWRIRGTSMSYLANFEANVGERVPYALRPQTKESLEMRWFGRGDVPNLLTEWMHDGPHTREGTRVDRYLGGCGNQVSLKIRDGGLEVKRLIGTEGRAERWLKQRTGAPAELPPRVGASVPLWIDVRKKRTLAKLALRDGEVHRVEPHTPIEAGCHVEVTVVRCNDAVWWTFSIEASGADEGDPLVALRETRVLLKTEEEYLDAHAQRLSYAGWLMGPVSAPESTAPAWSPAAASLASTEAHAHAAAAPEAVGPSFFDGHTD